MARVISLAVLSVSMLHATARSLPVPVLDSVPKIAHPSPKIGLVLALYNANVSTDWHTVAAAARRIPITAIVPVQGVSPPDPDWVPDYPSAVAYRSGVAMLRAAGPRQGGDVRATPFGTS